MIWESTIIMTLFDLAVIAGGMFVTLLIFRNRESLSENQSASNLFVIAFGILIVAGFYGADLFIMWGLPSMVGHEKSMAAMLFLHANVSWFVITASFGIVTVGLTLSFRSNARQIQAMKAEEDRVAVLLSEIEASENRFRAFFDNSPAIMFAKDKNHNITFANAKYLEFHQVEETDVCSKRGGKPLDDERRAKVEALDRKVMTEGGTAQLDMQITSRHGVSRDFLVTKFPIYGADNEVTGIGTINTDVTEQRQYESKLIAAKKDAENFAAEAETANRSKSEFLANMSHELRTPMNGVLGMASMLLESELSEEQRMQAEVIEQSGESLLSLLNDILDLSKIEAERIELEEIDFKITELLEPVTSIWQSLSRGKNLDFSIEVSPDVTPVVKGDVTRTRQILFNLVGNAAKFTEQGGVILTLSQQILSGNELELRFAVTDTGVGIAPDVLSKLFSDFTQADSSTTRKFGGTGLGLAISKRLVGLMGGEIGVESAEGEGSTFWFTIPCTVGDSQAIEDIDSAVGGIGHDVVQEDGRRLHILVAEDDPINQIVVRAILEKTSHQFEIVGNGLEAVAAVIRGRYDLVLMDAQMPEMDGVTATQKIRELPGNVANIPIIALTANAMAGDREMYLEAGMTDYVSKPIRQETLLEVIAKFRGIGRKDAA